MYRKRGGQLFESTNKLSWTDCLRSESKSVKSLQEHYVRLFSNTILYLILTTIRSVGFLIFFYRWEKWAAESLNDTPKTHHLNLSVHIGGRPIKKSYERNRDRTERRTPWSIFVVKRPQMSSLTPTQVLVKHSMWLRDAGKIGQFRSVVGISCHNSQNLESNGTLDLY